MCTLASDLYGVRFGDACPSSFNAAGTIESRLLFLISGISAMEGARYSTSVPSRGARVRDPPGTFRDIEVRLGFDFNLTASKWYEDGFTEKPSIGLLRV